MEDNNLFKATDRVDESIHLIGRIRENAHAFILDELKDNGVTNIVMSHGDIIVTLLKYNELSKSEIAKRVRKSQSTVTTLINKLIVLGYVKSRKDLDDNRFSIISLTEKGRELKPLFEKVSKDIFSVQYNGIKESDRAIFLEVLHKMYDNLK